MHSRLMKSHQIRVRQGAQQYTLLRGRGGKYPYQRSGTSKARLFDRVRVMPPTVSKSTGREARRVYPDWV